MSIALPASRVHEAANCAAPDMERVERELTETLAAARAQRFAWYTTERLARTARALDCFAVIRFDDSLPNSTRIDFVRQHIPEHIRRCDRASISAANAGDRPMNYDESELPRGDEPQPYGDEQ